MTCQQLSDSHSKMIIVFFSDVICPVLTHIRASWLLDRNDFSGKTDFGLKLIIKTSDPKLLVVY